MTTTTRRRMLAPILGIAFFALAGVQCEDPAARARADAQAEITRLAAELSAETRFVLQPGGEEFEAQRTDLEKILRDAKAIKADGGQGAAAALLAASTQRELAMMSLGEARELEASLRRERAVTATAATAAGRLHALAEGRSSIDLGRSRATLDQHATAAERLRTESSRQMAELDGPISQLSEGNQDDQGQIDQIVVAADELRRRAAELGPLHGFPHIEQAIALQRQIDQVENRMSHREIDLDYELHPEHRLAEARVGHARALLESVAQSRTSLQQYLEAMEDDAVTTRDEVRGLAGKLSETIEAMDAVMTQELAPHYLAAVEQLEQAVRLADQAAGKAGSDGAASAKLAAARLHAALGQVHATRVEGLSDHVTMLETLRQYEPTLELQGLQVRLTGAQKSRDEAQSSALAAYEAAQDALSRVRVREAQDAVADLGQSVLSAVATIRGEEAPAGEGSGGMPLTLPGAAAGGGASAGGAGGAGGPGGAGGEAGLGTAYTTHQDLVKRLASMPSSAEDLDQRLELVHATTPLGRALLRSQRALNPVLAAAMETWGPEALEPLMSMGGMGALRTATLDREEEDLAVYTAETMGMSQEFNMVRKRGNWYFDLDAMAQRSGPMGAMFQQQAQVLEKEGPALEQRIRDGEFASAQEFVQALTQTLMSAMTSPSGAGGDPGGGGP